MIIRDWYGLLYHKNEKGKPSEMELPLLKKDKAKAKDLPSILIL
jgi:hypothetical protein